MEMNGSGGGTGNAKNDWQKEIDALVPIDEQFKDGKYPHGEECTYYIKGRLKSGYAKVKKKKKKKKKKTNISKRI